MKINARQKQISLKLVYYGPGLSGKTTNLLQLHQSVPKNQSGELLRLDTDTERTLFFDYFPFNIGKIGGYQIKLDLFTVPGQSFYHETRRILLENVDGIVFVADSMPSGEGANLISLSDMKQSLQSWGRSIDEVPLVFQWNKRDVARPLPVSVLQRTLNPDKRPALEAVATRGQGVVETQNTLVSLVLNRLRKRSAS